MKIRGKHILGLAVVGLVFGVALVLVWGAGQDHEGSPSEEDFLNELHALQQQVPRNLSDAGVPPVDAARDLVPEIAFETEAMHMGVIANDDVTAKPLKVMNRGKATLTINDIQPSCACTLGSIPEEDSAIAPGGEATINVLVNPFRIPSFHSKKTLTILSNDPHRPSVTVSVEVDIDPEILVLPDELDFGAVAKGEPIQRKVILRQAIDTPFTLTGIHPSNDPKAEPPEHPEITATFLQRPEEQWQTPGKAEYEMTVQLEAIAPPGDFLRALYIATDIQRLRRFPYRVRAKIDACYTVTPAYPAAVTLGGIGPGAAGKPGRVTVSADQPIELTGITADPKILKAKLGPADGPNEAHIELRLADDVPPGQFQTDLLFTVRADGRQFPERVPVRGFVAEPPPAQDEPAAP